MDINKIIELAEEKGASDIHITVGLGPMVRIDGSLEQLTDEKIMPEKSKELVESVLTSEFKQTLEDKGEVDFSYSYANKGRFRINAYKQRGTYSMALRSIPIEIPTAEDLNLPSVITDLAMKRRGLVLVTGPTGSGKSTTLAAMINHINKTKSEHILTLEDPIEYLHRHQKSMVNQREIGNDSHNFANALRAALRQDPDVILIGEMRDNETIGIALKAAETGHLVLATLHTIGAAKTIDRIVDSFPPHQQQQIRVQLSSVVEGIVSQQLLPKIDGGRVASQEIMVASTAIRNLVREGKTHQLLSTMQTSAGTGMETMDRAIQKLYDKGKIDYETAIKFAVDPDKLMQSLGRKMY